MVFAGVYFRRGGGAGACSSSSRYLQRSVLLMPVYWNMHERYGASRHLEEIMSYRNGGVGHPERIYRSEKGTTAFSYAYTLTVLSFFPLYNWNLSCCHFTVQLSILVFLIVSDREKIRDEITFDPLPNKQKKIQIKNNISRCVQSVIPKVVKIWLWFNNY